MNKRLYLSNSLTPKELEVFFAIVEKGIFKTSALARKFFVSSATIRTHLQNIYTKLNINSMTELVYRYYNEKQISRNKNNN